MAELRTDFKDDILAEAMGGRRRYQMIQNEDGTVSFVDATEYEQMGSEFGQAEINATNAAVIALQNEQVETADPMTATEEGLAADAKLTGDALRDLSANINEKNINTFGEKVILTSGVDYICPSDGYFVLLCPWQQNSSSNGYVNGMLMLSLQARNEGSMNGNQTGCMFVRKGMTIKYVKGAKGTAGSGSFIPLS